MNDLDLVVERTGHTRFRDLVRDRPEYGAVVAKLAAQYRGEAPAVTAASSEPILDQWHYVTTAQLVADTLALLPQLPADLDAVVGIARSGLLPASLVATARHVPLWTCSRGQGLTDPGHGGRMDGATGGDPRHVVVVDDTAALGREMPAAAALVRERWPAARITRAVVYCTPQARRAVDLCAAIYPGAHYLEWNWCNAGHGAACGYDFDGVLCHDDDPARPLFLPRRAPVPLIATGRHESRREVTEAWLDRWGVRCERLVMRDFDAPGEYDPDRIAAFKASHYQASKCILFAESDPWQAERIAEITGRAVLCPQLGRVIPPRLEAPRPTVTASAAFMRRVRSCPHWRAGRSCCDGVRCDLDPNGRGWIDPRVDCAACPELPS